MLDAGHYLETRHAQKRMRERGITTHDIWDILRTGTHEKRKDEYDEAFATWKYAFRGSPQDDPRTLRIVAALADDGVLVITAIHLEGSL